MSVIYKYQLELTDFPVVEMPIGATIRHVGVQDGSIFIWAEVDPGQEKKNRPFCVVGTGRNVPARAKWFIGTVQMPPFVWHVYSS